MSLTLAKYSFGVGDRFAHEARAQLEAFLPAVARGVEIAPVWNKSNREHLIVGSEPDSALAAAREAVRELHWTAPYHLDADHINRETVGRFLPACDFFTLDVADYIGRPAAQAEVDAFVARHPELLRPMELAGVPEPVRLTAVQLREVAEKYLFAAQEAGRIHRLIETAKGRGAFITEVSMDETDAPQLPAELLVILAALADEGVPAATIAPKFTGRFNKGVDYVGDVARFEAEFRADLAVIAHAVQAYDLPAALKLSVHSGSDKFSIYPAIRRALVDTDAGVHVKTAGTTWLEEVIGLAEHGGSGLEMAKRIYANAFDHREELCAPYATVIDVEVANLPLPDEVERWTSGQLVAALRHDESCPDYNPDLRQLVHVGYKVAARLGGPFLAMLDECRETIAPNVTDNLYDRHIRRIFPGLA